MIHIYDANNHFRRKMEDKMPTPVSMPRQAFTDARDATDLEFYVWDGYNHNARRREFFDGYKRREPVAEDVYTGLQFLRQLLVQTKAIQVEVPEWEADDVIGVLARHFAKKGHDVTVHTNDLDYFQLLDTPGIKLPGVKNPTGVPPEWLPLYKAMVGDTSDKIPGIPNFGPKAFEALELHWSVIQDYIRTNGWYDDIPLKPGHKAWIWENQDLLYAYWKIVHLWDVPLELINEHTYSGVNNPEAGEALLRKFML